MRLIIWLKRFISVILGPLFILLTVGIITTVGIWAYYTAQLPDVETLKKNVVLQHSLKVYSKGGELIAEFGQYKRRPVKSEDIPDQLANAFISIEDSRFYEHKGIDFYGVARAIVAAVKNRNASQGASTITMQVARNFFLTRRKKLDRKIKEIFLAHKLETIFSKEKILELYLNKIFLGKRAYGIGSAAEVYYGKTVDQLTLAQSAMIAGLPKAPSAYNPIINPKRALERRNYILLRMKELGHIEEDAYNHAKQEPLSAKIHATAKTETNAPYVAEMVRQKVLAKYKEITYSAGLKVYTTIDSDEQKNAVSVLRKHLIKYHKRHGYYGPTDTIDLSHYSDEQALLKKLSSYSIYADLIPAVVTTSSQAEAHLITLKGERITLPLSALTWARKHISENRRGKKPTSAQDVLKVGDIVRVSQNQEGDWSLTPAPRISGALVSMNPNNGAILSIVGGFDYKKSRFNRAIQAKRQPGSSFKPFVYSAALAKGYSPASVVNDAPIKIKGSKWRPQNYSGRTYGPTRLRQGLKKSRNLVSIQLLREIGVLYTHKYVQKYGFNADEVPKNLTMALGTGSVTPLQMAGAYSTFANGGYKIEPHIITHIINHDGEVLFNAPRATACYNCKTNKVIAIENNNPMDNSEEFNSNSDSTKETNKTANEVDIETTNTKAAKRIMKPYVHYEIVSMMKSVAQSGTAARTRRLKRKDIAGKTGTTNDQKDAWFAGFTPRKVAIVWIGFDQIQPMGKRETATGLALPTWIDFMETALKDVPEIALKPPKNMITVRIDSYTGFRADRHSSHSILETITPKQNPGYTRNTAGRAYVRVNNPKNPTIFIGHKRRATTTNTTSTRPTTSNTNTRTIIIDGEQFEIPEQLF
ncbi:MAG TPA: penicillin-binding protein 1A [Thiothrix sp.]|nr:penicillin-binding protein 1A [Thiothrix sp.]